jgi:hypothetical protein
MRRNLSILSALALFILACHRVPTATAGQRAGMGPAVEARLATRHLTVKAEIQGPQSEHLKILSEEIGDPTVEMMAYRGYFADFCGAGFTDIELSDGHGWTKLWKC